ncbi:Pantoate-beta-alanine ligase [Thamnocephalis sphaerospora]|uniref:Pantoate--beta-alanine ligase n=1 Tax=Thamnocephalis sphaerospora TaxID=78915 RepID=A0A4P9XRL2_9FUNG|nr:Pantoate-beta-alanine ligase [Thamnocephalis sphaerospora]|eukprot:RKP08725.1 Pantoate-beta-alanine ligase [Thamnocephalis sphaerospora]
MLGATNLSDDSRAPLLIHSVADLRRWRRNALMAGKTVGMVPTMGALHDGHLNLVRRARTSCDLVVVCIYVNPSQFAPHEDLDQYPRTLQQDIALLGGSAKDAARQTDASATGCLADVVFAPSNESVYPDGITTVRKDQRGAFVEVLGLSHQMEGVTRPHFFRGVATIVTKLINLVQPDRVFFGQKDAQQCVVVRSLIRNLCLPVEMTVVETTREQDGLAMSSRNRYLTAEERQPAIALYKALRRAQTAYLEGERRRSALMELANAEISAAPNVSLEYLSLAHPRTLDELDNIGEDGAIISGAIRMPSARLIDNLLLGCEL